MVLPASSWWLTRKPTSTTATSWLSPVRPEDSAACRLCSSNPCDWLLEVEPEAAQPTKTQLAFALRNSADAKICAASTGLKVTPRVAQVCGPTGPAGVWFPVPAGPEHAARTRASSASGTKRNSVAKGMPGGTSNLEQH